jgi:lysophospholipase L1-like esterase
MFGVIVFAVLATLGTAGTASAVKATNYVALGDSFSSGLGAGSYDSSGGCKRSSNAYPQFWADRHAGTRFSFVVITTCTLDSDQVCIDRVNRAKAYANNTLPALLDKVYATIKKKGPSARLIVLGYPRFYTVPGSCNIGLSDTKRSAINSGADTLATVIGSRARAAGATFVDVRPNFTGHNICSSGTQYLHSLTWPADESYHPTVAGQSSGYYPALKAVTG